MTIERDASSSVLYQSRYILRAPSRGDLLISFGSLRSDGQFAQLLSVHGKSVSETTGISAESLRPPPRR